MRFVRKVLAVVFSLQISFLVFSPFAFAETIELVTYFPAPAAAGGGDQQMRSVRVGNAAYQAQPVPPVGVGLFQDAVGIGVPVPGDGAPTLPAGVVLGVQGAPGAADRVVFLPGAGGTLNVGIGTATANEQLELTGNLRLPVTTATTGILFVGADRFLHNFGTNNTFLGIQAGNLTMTGTGTNTGLGKGSLSSNTTGSYNTAVGDDTLSSNTTGSYNTAVGVHALYSNTSGGNNTALGSNVLATNTTGNNNVAMGHYALYLNTTGSYNTAVGPYALYSNTTGSSNAALGHNALFGNTTGERNTALGVHALYSNTSGSSNTALGYYALTTNTSGSSNTALGYHVLRSNTTGINNAALGSYALDSNTTGGSNTAVGHGALDDNTTGDNNTAVGHGALDDNTTGGFNTALGDGALPSNTTGGSNTAVGYAALSANEAGNSNVAIGLEAGHFATGTGNVFLGYQAGYSETGSDRLYIDNSNTGAPLIYGNFATNAVAVNGQMGIGVAPSSHRLTLPNTNDDLGKGIAKEWPIYSSIRWKENLAPIPAPLEKVLRLRGLYYISKGSPRRNIGMVAEEVGKVLPEVVSYEENGQDAIGLAYDGIVPLLVEALKEQQRQIEALKRRISSLEKK